MPRLNTTTLLAVLTAVAFSAPPGLSAKEARLALPTSALECRMTGRAVYVYDGDTMTIRFPEYEKSMSVRLYGIDCPERNQSFGDEARVFTRSRALNKDVTVLLTEKDRYERLVGLVLLPDGRCLNEDLLAEGLAWFNHPPSYVRLEESRDHQGLRHMRDLMGEARRLGRGLWSERHPLHPGKFRHMKVRGDLVVYLTKKGTRFHRADCRWAARTGRSVTLLEALGRGYRQCSDCRPLEKAPYRR